MKDTEICDAVLSGRLLSANVDKTVDFVRGLSNAEVSYRKTEVRKTIFDVLTFKGKTADVIKAIEVCAEYDLFEPKYVVDHPSTPRVKRVMKTVKDKRLSDILKKNGVQQCYGKFGFRHITPKTISKQQETDVLMIKKCLSCEVKDSCANAKLIEQNEEIKGYLARSITSEE